jgi:hypothetical protein
MKGSRIYNYSVVLDDARRVRDGVPGAALPRVFFLFVVVVVVVPVFVVPDSVPAVAPSRGRHVTGCIRYTLHGGTLTTHATKTLHAKVRIVVPKSPQASHPRR